MHSPITRRMTSRYNFTEREAQIYEHLVIWGRGYPEIGKLIGLSRNTVKNHVASMFQKVHCNSDKELIAAGVRAHLEATCIEYHSLRVLNASQEEMFADVHINSNPNRRKRGRPLIITPE